MEPASENPFCVINPVKLETTPNCLVEAFNLWSSEQSDESGRKVLQMLNPYLNANFVPINLDTFETIVPDDSEIDAIEVILHGFDFDDELGLPIIAATAIFDIPLHEDINERALLEWEEDNDDQFGFAFNFFWEFDDDQVFLDTHNGVEWWMSDQ